MLQVDRAGSAPTPLQTSDSYPGINYTVHLNSPERALCGNSDQCDGTMVCGRFNHHTNTYQCCPVEWSMTYDGVLWCANQPGGDCSDGLDQNCMPPAECKSNADSRSGYTCTSPPTTTTTATTTTNMYPHPVCVDGAENYECFSPKGFCKLQCDGPPPCNWQMMPCAAGTTCINPRTPGESPCVTDP